LFENFSMKYKLAIFDFDGTLADAFPFFSAHWLKKLFNNKCLAPEQTLDADGAFIALSE